jgi:muramidase (phage lysozyme)
MTDYRSALLNPNVRAFLAVIRAGEGTSDPDGYRRHFGGELFSDFSQHPKRAITKLLGGQPLTSTAAGAYQFLSKTWSECQNALKLPDFSPESQDLAAVYLIDRRGALDAVIRGDLEVAIAKCAKEWASLPGSPYGQPTKTLAQCIAVYEAAGGTHGTAPPVESKPEKPTAPRPDADNYPEAPMPIPAIVTALLPSVIELLPKLGGLFGSGSKASERNLAVAGAVLDLAQKTTGAVNAQAAIETMKSDPTALAAVSKAVEAHWFDLSEGGGGGIEGARKADKEARESDGPFWGFLKSPSFWMLLLSLPLVYIVVGSIAGLWGYVGWSDDVRASLATAVVSLIIGGAAGYFWGQTTSRNRTPGGA